jgi:protein-tyrosine-phosphatase
MRAILFLCSHGGAKSVIAASYFNRLAAERNLPFVAVAASTEDPYDSVPPPVSDYLHGEGFDVRPFKPHQVVPSEVGKAARIVTMGCDVPAAEGAPDRVERWDDVPQPSVDLERAAAAIREHVAALAEELDGDR